VASAKLRVHIQSPSPAPHSITTRVEPVAREGGEMEEKMQMASQCSKIHQDGNLD
jgi:hypothetical protein